MNDFPTAEQARAASESIENEVTQKTLEKLREEITSATGKGKRTITVYALPEPVKGFLKAKGYRVEYNPGDPRDQRDAAYWTVSW